MQPKLRLTFVPFKGEDIRNFTYTMIAADTA